MSFLCRRARGGASSSANKGPARLSVPPGPLDATRRDVTRRLRRLTACESPLRERKARMISYAAIMRNVETIVKLCHRGMSPSAVSPRAMIPWNAKTERDQRGVNNLTVHRRSDRWIKDAEERGRGRVAPNFTFLTAKVAQFLIRGSDQPRAGRRGIRRWYLRAEKAAASRSTAGSHTGFRAKTWIIRRPLDI